MSLLALEPLLLARLREQLPPGVPVLPKASLDAQAEGLLRAPAVYVIYAGGEVAERRPDGRAVKLRQRWLCLVAVRNLAESTSGQPAREDAGTLADVVLTALMGWQPPGASAPLSLVELPDLGYVAGYQTLPLVFATELVRSVKPV